MAKPLCTKPLIAHPVSYGRNQIKINANLETCKALDLLPFQIASKLGEMVRTQHVLIVFMSEDCFDDDIAVLRSALAAR